MTTNSINYQRMLSEAALNQSKVRVHIATALQQEAEAARTLALTPYQATLARTESILAAAKEKYADRYASADVIQQESAAELSSYDAAYAKAAKPYVTFKALINEAIMPALQPSISIAEAVGSVLGGIGKLKGVKAGATKLANQPGDDFSDIYGDEFAWDDLPSQLPSSSRIPGVVDQILGID